MVSPVLVAEEKPLVFRLGLIQLSCTKFLKPSKSLIPELLRMGEVIGIEKQVQP